MDPDEVFSRFNNIIGPEFSLITGRRLCQACTDCKGESNTHGDTQRGENLAEAVSKTAPQERLRELNKKSDEEILQDQKLAWQRKTSRNIHGTLFRPNELVYIERDPASLTKVAQDEYVLLTDIEGRATSIEDEGFDGKAAQGLPCVRAFHNGQRFGVTKHSIEIGSSQETVNLTAKDLGAIPMRLLPPVERQDIQARLMSRGNKYRWICERSPILMQYEGPVIPLGQGTDWTWTTNQRLVVDEMAGREIQCGRDNGRLTTSHRQQILEASLNTEDHSLLHGDGSSSSQAGDLSRDDAMPNAKGKQKSLENEKTAEDHNWTDIDYLTCPPTLVAFLLNEKVWANVEVEHLTDIVWPERPFDSLELETRKKELLQNLTRRFKTKEISEGWHQDTSGGQGGNLILFLSGPPGVGKTLTGEVIAEEIQRPLYRMSAGELSVDPSALEKQLGDIFILGRRWEAIIFIDEADVFMAKRQASTPDQNAAVTGTSKDIDPAFYDHIHATIKYTGLDETQRKNIWRRQLQRAVGSPEEHLLSSRWPEETYRLLGKVETNGRDIRNIVRTAEQLALGLSTELAVKHVAAAMRNFGGSDNDVESICEQLEMLEEKVGGGRDQACDDDVELPYSIGGRSDGL
ncbi:Fidgetin-like protein 1 [Colletotrichum tropicale]|nr:Fidgetin-like protein 1 [Colletotrichum tropicale]